MKAKDVLKQILYTLLVMAGFIGLTYTGFGVFIIVLMSAAMILWHDFRSFIIPPILVAITYFVHGEYGLENALFAFGAVVASYIAWGFLAKKKPYRILVIVNTIVIAITLLSQLIITSSLAGVAPSKLITQTIMSMIGGNASTYAKVISDSYIAIYIVMAMLYSGISTVITTIVLRLLGYDMEKLKLMAPPEFWTLSKNFTIAMATIALCVAVVNIIGLNHAASVNYIALAIIGTPLCVQGFCFLLLIGRSGCFFIANPLLLSVIVMLTMPISLVILAGIGLFDQFSRKRTHVKYIKIDPQTGLPIETADPSDDNKDNEDVDTQQENMSDETSETQSEDNSDDNEDDKQS